MSSPVNLAAEIKVIMINVKTNFPFSRSIQRELTNLGADIKNGDIALCDLKTAEAVSFVLAKILEFEDDQDPLVQPTFALVGAVTEAVQNEVYNIIASYQTLLAVDFAGGVLPPIMPALLIPPAFMWHFHHTQMGVVGVVSRLSNPGPGAHTGTIDILPIGSFICDLSLIYGNVVFVLRVCRHPN